MYDLHAHILPGLDDGARTAEDALAMAEAAARDGTRVMLATPHRKDVTEGHSIEYAADLLSSMNERIRERGIDLTLLMGMENHIDPELPRDLADGRALPINGSRYALVELPFFGYAEWVEEVLFSLQLQNITPVLAHPERLEAFQQDPERLVRFVERGMLSQVTGGSLLGHFSGPVKRLTVRMMRRGLVHVIASDTHSHRGPRSPELSRAVAAASEIVGPERARAMVEYTPKAILENLPVEADPLKIAEETRRWWWPWGGG